VGPKIIKVAVARLWLVGLAAVVASWAICSLWWPFGWDQGCFAYVGDVINHGGMPYRDAWDPKGPLAFYVFAALQFVFGRQMWAIRGLDVVLAAGAGYAAFVIVSRFATRFAGIATALLMVLAFASFGNWYTAQPDGWAALGLVGTVALLVHDREGASVRDVAVAGFIIGCCALLKPLYSVYLLLVVCAVWPAVQSERAAGVRRVALSTGFYLLPIVLVVGWIAAHGALADMIDVHVRFHVERMGTEPEFQMSITRAVQITLGVFTVVPLLAVAAPAAALGVGYLVREERRPAVMMTLWVLLSLALIASQRKFLPQNYSWHPLYPPIVILAGIGLARLWESATPQGAPVRWLVIAAVLLMSKLVTRDPLTQAAHWAQLIRGRTTLAQYQGTFETNVPALGGKDSTSFGFSVPRDVEIARYLQEHSRTDQRVLVWSDPLVNYLSDRGAITPVTLGAAFTQWGSEERRARYRAELITNMQSDSAAYFGIPAKDLLPADEETNIPTYFPALATELEAHYEEVERFGDVRMFKHRAATSAPDQSARESPRR
jgi:hypothetical protein